MKYVLALVKPFRAEGAVAAARRTGCLGLTAREAKGYGRQKDRLPDYKAGEFDQVYLPKIELAFSVEDSDAERLLADLCASARTGRIGDGKIIVVPILGSFEF
jgi:nitrogen regulatory protein PII